MDRRRVLSLSLLSICTVAAVLLLQWRFEDGTEREKVRARYAQLRRAMLLSDTNAASLLFLPALQARVPDEMNRLQIFAHDLGLSSTITIKDDQAWICPRRELPFIPLLRVGHEIEMRRVGNEWYLTGKISIW